jgi:hypothetical protein
MVVNRRTRECVRPVMNLESYSKSTTQKKKKGGGQKKSKKYVAGIT